jgi:hypothetical protein
VRYIHLNPLRAGLVKDLDALDNYAFSGHGGIMAKHQQSWQDSRQVLACFGTRAKAASRHLFLYDQALHPWTIVPDRRSFGKANKPRILHSKLA